MKKTTLRKSILITLALIIVMGVLSSNVFAAVPVIVSGQDGNNTSTFTVTFNTNGGSIVASQSVTSGNKATRPATNPTREGFTFDDWYADSSFTTKFNFDEAITANTTVYAKWTSSASVTPTPTPTPTPAATPTTNQDSSLPQTGDASDYAIFALIGLCAVVSVVAFVKAKKYNLK
ncbi:MAG: InlB B-repeat-containing protein [Clostridia bacterium]|nr:InlB B-repeat-containing protein [Clostridia bacterium]